MLVGLYPYEKLLAVLGTILFGSLVVVLLVYVFQRRAVTALLPFFLVSVVMIGFPGIQKVSYDNGKLELERALASYEQRPNDAVSRARLAATVDKVAPRIASDPQGSLVAARALTKLDQPERAIRTVQPALEAQPTRREALELQRELVRRDPRLAPIARERSPGG
jgi:hypothetical protein